MRKKKSINKKTRPPLIRKKPKQEIAKIAEEPSVPKSESLNRAAALLKYGIDSVNNLYLLYHGKGREIKAGAPKYVQQDILRAMLVMAGATLDSTIKRIIENSFPDLVKYSNEALDYAIKYIDRNIMKQLANEGGEFLARAFLHEAPGKQMIEYIIEDITGESLQSVEQINKVAAMLAVDLKASRKYTPSILKDAFEARNKIVHEMDAGSAKTGWKRIRRKKDMMVKYSQSMLNLSNLFIHEVDRQLVHTSSQ